MYRQIRHSFIIALCALLTFTVVAQAEPLTGIKSQVPASQSELSQRGQSLKVNVFGPVKGLATNISDLTRDGDFATTLDNLHQIKRGVWTTRGTGYAKDRAGNFNSGASFLGNIEPLTNSSGDFNIVFQVGDTPYGYDPSTETETQLYTTALSTTAIPQIKAYDEDTCIYVNGDIEPLKWDLNLSNDFVALGGGWPITAYSGFSFSKPSYQEVFAGRFVTAGYSAHPHTILLSDFGDPETYTNGSSATDGGAISLPSRLGAIVGIRTLRLDTTTNEQVLIVGCERGFGIITGSSALDFEGMELTQEFGLLSNRSWAQVSNDLYFAATDGIRRISSNLGTATLAIAPLTFGLNNLWNRINTAKKEEIHVLHHPKTQEVLWYLPIDSDTACNNGIVMNYNVETEDNSAITSTSIDRPLFSTVSGYTSKAAITAEGTAFFGTSDGYLMNLFSGDSFDSSAITWSYVTPLIGAASPAQNASAVRFIIMTNGGTQKFDLAAFTLSTMSSGVTKCIARDTGSVDATGASTTAVTTWDTGTTTEYAKMHDFFSKGSGRFWMIKISGNATDEHIDLVGIQSILKIGGWRQ